jgi:hypothetical protein
VAVAGKIRHEDGMTGGERRRERPPVLDRPAEPVHEHERRAVPIDGALADGIAKPRSTPLELALLESVQSAFAVRHHRGIFFWSWMLPQGGLRSEEITVMSANTTSQGAT